MLTYGPQHQPTRFTGEVWVKFFCQALGAPIPLLRAHAVARTQCACKIFVFDQYGDRVLTCKKHTGAIAGHDHVMNVTAQLARNSGLKVRVNNFRQFVRMESGYRALNVSRPALQIPMTLFLAFTFPRLPLTLKFRLIPLSRRRRGM